MQLLVVRSACCPLRPMRRRAPGAAPAGHARAPKRHAGKQRRRGAALEQPGPHLARSSSASSFPSFTSCASCWCLATCACSSSRGAQHPPSFAGGWHAGAGSAADGPSTAGMERRLGGRLGSVAPAEPPSWLPPRLQAQDESQGGDGCMGTGDGCMGTNGHSASGAGGRVAPGSPSISRRRLGCTPLEASQPNDSMARPSGFLPSLPPLSAMLCWQGRRWRRRQWQQVQSRQWRDGLGSVSLKCLELISPPAAGQARRSAHGCGLEPGAAGRGLWLRSCTLRMMQNRGMERESPQAAFASLHHLHLCHAGSGA